MEIVDRFAPILSYRVAAQPGRGIPRRTLDRLLVLAPAVRLVLRKRRSFSLTALTSISPGTQSKLFRRGDRMTYNGGLMIHLDNPLRQLQGPWRAK